MRDSNQNQPQRVSVHGGHSREFCLHAQDTLEEIIRAYIDRGFAWVGITEHMPPVDNRFRYPDEVEAGLDAQTMYDRFARYIHTCRELKEKYAAQIELLVAFETETHTGSTSFIHDLIRKFKPDYIVGSVHHVDDIGFDISESGYRQAADAAGSVDALYCRYFDQQHEMIKALQSPVVGHFDLVRIFDPAYPSRLRKPEIRERIRRNLELIRDLGLILDLNVRALVKGAGEPYVSRPILEQALALGIPVVPGDDSHGVDTVGLHVEDGIRLLRDMGFDLNWPKPSLP